MSIDKRIERLQKILEGYSDSSFNVEFSDGTVRVMDVGDLFREMLRALFTEN